jgi:hypothetical protein
MARQILIDQCSGANYRPISDPNLFQNYGPCPDSTFFPDFGGPPDKNSGTNQSIFSDPCFMHNHGAPVVVTKIV